MISPYGDKRLCALLPVKTLERTFFYPGPGIVRDRPSKFAQRAWDRAKETCIECPFYLQCRERCWGEEYGVIGGTDQYERHLYRRRRQREYREMTAERQAALRAHVHSRAGTLDAITISGEVGLSVRQIRIMCAEHEAALAAQRSAAQAAARDAVGWTARVVWPVGHPLKGDGWLFREGQILQGHYVAETPDGEWVRMKFRAMRMPIIKWLPKAHVDLRTEVSPIIAEYAGRRPDATQIDCGEPAAA